MCRRLLSLYSAEKGTATKEVGGACTQANDTVNLMSRMCLMLKAVPLQLFQPKIFIQVRRLIQTIDRLQVCERRKLPKIVSKLMVEIFSVKFSSYFFFPFKGNLPVVRCENGCCEDSPCLNGGTCHETCDIIGKRFTCECGLYATGNLCETGTALDLSCISLFVFCQFK